MTSNTLKKGYDKKKLVDELTDKCREKAKNLPVQQGAAFAYTRVSLILDKNKKLTGESISLDNQDQLIEEYCKNNNLVIVGRYSDPNVSGKDIEHRKGLQSLLQDLRKNIVVVCSQISRLSRNTEDLLGICRVIQKEGARLVLLDLKEDPHSSQGQFMLSLFGGIATMERTTNNQRISQCMRNASKEGKLIKCPKFGYSVVNKEYVENHEEQKVIEYIKALLEYDPDMLPNSITTDLKEKGFKNKKGNPLHVTTVQSIIREIKTPTIQPMMERMKKQKEYYETLKNKTT